MKKLIVIPMVVLMVIGVFAQNSSAEKKVEKKTAVAAKPVKTAAKPVKAEAKATLVKASVAKTETKAAAPDPGCSHGGEQFPTGSIICMGGKQHECKSNGQWVNIGFSCK